MLKKSRLPNVDCLYYQLKLIDEGKLSAVSPPLEYFALTRQGLTLRPTATAGFKNIYLMIALIALIERLLSMTEAYSLTGKTD